MSYLGNTPPQETVLRLEARKSFSLGLVITDQSGRPVDLTGCTIRIVAKKPPFDAADSVDASNLIANHVAGIIEPVAGVARFDLQASDLDHDPGEYPFAIVLLTEGYSIVIVRGVIDLVPNPEFASAAAGYAGANPASALTVALRDQHTIDVRTGAALTPGTTSFTDGDKAKLDSIEAGAQVNQPIQWSDLLNKPDFGTAALVDVAEVAVPQGGSPGEILTKLSAIDGDYAWAQPPATGPAGTLNATGVLSGYVPTANGSNGWSWQFIPPPAVTSVASKTGAVTLNMGDISDTASFVRMTAVERTKLSALNSPPAWADISGKPAFGTAALTDSTAYLPSTGISGSVITSGTVAAARLPKLSGLQGLTAGTAAPSGGVDGDYYFQYS